MVTDPGRKGLDFRDHRGPFSEELGALCLSGSSARWARAGVLTHEEFSRVPPPVRHRVCQLFEIHFLLLESGRRVAWIHAGNPASPSGHKAQPG